MLQPKPARLPEPAASGTLASKPFAHLLIYALDRKLSGTFELADTEEGSVHVYVSDGKVSRVAVSEPVTYLGHVLYELGTIDDTQLSSSLAEVAASKRLHGQVLLERGAIDEAQLAEALGHQRARNVQHAFKLPPRTTFAFYAEIDLIGERPNDVEPVDPLSLVWRGVREHPSWDHVRTTIKRVGGRAIRMVPDASLDRLAFDEDERAAAECLRHKPSTVPELAIVGGLTIQATDLLAYFLVITKQVEVVEPLSAPTSVAPPATMSSGPPMRINTPGNTFASGEYVRKISFAMRAVTPESTIRIPSPVPNRMPSPMPGRLASPMPGRLASPRPGSVSSAPPIQRIASSIPPRTSSAPPRGLASVPPGSMPPTSDLARKKSIVDRAKWIDQEDFFKMLMVGREATTDEIRAAFLRAAKVWHPDTLPPSIGEVRAECEFVFTKITAAFETLVDPDKRSRYERSMHTAMRDNAEADHFLSQAAMHMTLDERDQAESLVRKALVAAPGLPEAGALLAYLEATDPRRAQPEHFRAQIRKLDIAIGKDPTCRRAHYFRADLRKRLGEHEGAIRDLRTAVINDPDDVDAQRELKLYERRIREGTVQIRSLSPFGTKRVEKEGFFDRLRKK